MREGHEILMVQKVTKKLMVQTPVAIGHKIIAEGLSNIHDPNSKENGSTLKVSNQYNDFPFLHFRWQPKKLSKLQPRNLLPL